MMRVLSTVLSVLILVVLVALQPFDARAGQSNADYGNGIYVINAVTNNLISPSVKVNPYIDGVVLQVGWNTIEPREGNFNWSSIDSIITQAATAGLHVSIVLMPGYQTPSWVYSDGAKQFQFVWDIATWGPKVCTVQTIPVPWDAVYLSKWNTMVSALGARYSNNTTVASVKVTGINGKTGELFLPTATAQSISSGKISCKSNNDITNWQGAGYTRLKVESAWNSIMQMFAQAFPETKLEAMLLPAGFPSIDDNGIIFAAPYSQDDQVTNDIITSGVSEYPSQFVIQNDGSSATWTWKVLSGYAGQIMTGVQENHAQGSLTSQAIKTALAAGANYIELYPTDALASSTQAELAIAHGLLE